MSTRSRIRFSDSRDDAVAAIASVTSGAGWCNVIPGVVDDVKDLQLNVFGLWVNQGVVVASFVTGAPRRGVAQPSTLGVLHTRGRLGRERIASLVGDTPFQVRQDHSQRGLLLGVPADTPAVVVLNVMCSLTGSLCDYEQTNEWRLDLFLR